MKQEPGASAGGVPTRVWIGILIPLVVIIVIVVTVAVGKALLFAPVPEPRAPATVEAAQKMLREFLRPDANLGRLNARLQPTLADCRAVFLDPADAERACRRVQKLVPLMPIRPASEGDLRFELRGGQIWVWRASASELRRKKMPGFQAEWSRVAPRMHPETPIFAYWYVGKNKKQAKKGPRAQGLINIDGRWVRFDDVWRAFKDDA